MGDIFYSKWVNIGQLLTFGQKLTKSGKKYTDLIFILLKIKKKCQKYDKKFGPNSASRDLIALLGTVFEAQILSTM